LFAAIALGALSSATARAAVAQFTRADTEIELILALADQRLALMPAVAAVKWQTHAPIFDATRETAVLQRAADLGAPLGLADQPLRQLFALQARLAREVQTQLHGKWTARGFSYSEPITTLAALRPKLDALTVDMLQAVYLATSVLQQDDFEGRYGASAQQQLQTFGWTDQNRQELLAILHSVRVAPVPPLQRITSSGVLRIGTTGDYAPFSLEANGALSGSDIDLAQQLAARLHVRAVFIHTTWATMVDDLEQGTFDVSVGGVSITPAREAQGAFSIPYSSGGKTVLARCADSRTFRAGLVAVDRPKVRVIVNPGGTNEQYVRSNVHHAQIIVFPDNRTVFEELAAGRADVMITDDVEAQLQSHRHPGLCRVFPGTLTHAEKAIFMARDPDLVQAVNDWLTPAVAAVAAGEPARLLENYLHH
jgi:cyclohexadienyl dehydratase